MKTIKHIFLVILFLTSLTLSGAVSAQYGPPLTDCTDDCDEPGCTDSEADNYNSNATVEDGSCTYSYYCRDAEASNYSSQQPGREDNSLCNYDYYCRDSSATNADLSSPGRTDNSLCNYDLYGCMDSGAKNFDASANVDDGSCYYTCEGQDYEEDRCAAVCSGNYAGCIYGNSTNNKRAVAPDTIDRWTCQAKESSATDDCDNDQGKAKCNNSTKNGCAQGTGSGATKSGDSWNWTCEYNGTTDSCTMYDPDILPRCGNTKDSCNVGSFVNGSQSETQDEFRWGCTGTNQSIMCSVKKDGKCNNNIKDGCLIGSSTGAKFDPKTNQWEWVCENRPAKDSPLCKIAAVTECESTVVYGCTDGGRAVDLDKAKTPGKFNWKCQLNAQISGLCEINKDPACDNSIKHGCTPGKAVNMQISLDGQYDLWNCELDGKTSNQCEKLIEGLPPVGVNRCSGAVLESATNNMSSICTNGNLTNPAYSQKNENGIISNIITGLCSSNICTNNFGNYIRITAPDGSNNQIIQSGGTATFKVTVRNINININTLTVFAASEALKNVITELPGAPDCNRSIAQTAILHSAMFPTFDPSETFSYLCNANNVTRETFSNGKATIQFNAETNLGTNIETTDTTNVTITDNNTSKCLDVNNDGKYDSCSTTGNGPLCSSDSNCTTLPPITSKCLDSDGNGKYDSCSTTGNGPLCSSDSNCTTLPPVTSKCLDANNDGKYDSCSILGAGPECSSDTACKTLSPENSKCLDSDKDGIYDSCSTTGNGQTCSTDNGCAGIVITANRCLDANNDGNYDSCSTLGSGPVCASAQACINLPPTNSKCLDGDNDGNYDSCSTSGAGPTCSTNAGCLNTTATSNKCLDSDSDGKYDACGFLGTGPLCASVQPCLELPPTDTKNNANWNVAGKVFYDDNKNGSPDEGEGVSRVQIELLNNNTGTRWFKISDTNGDFDINEIPEGAYNLKMTGDGKIVFPQLIPITISGGDYRGTFSGLRQVDFLTNPTLSRLSLTGLYGKIGVGVTDLKEGKFEATTSEYKVGDVSQNSFLSILEKGFSLENTSFSPIPLSTVTPKIAENGVGICGDGIIDKSEICDDGNKNGRTGYCSTDCLFTGEVRPGSEEDLLLSSAVSSGESENYQNSKNRNNKNGGKVSGLGTSEEIATKITNYLSESPIVQEIASSFIVKEAAKLVDKVVGLDNAKKALKTGLIVTTEAAVVTAEVAKYSVIGVSILLGTAAAGLNLMVFKTHWMKYTVQVGDTLDNISDKFTMTERALRKKNPLFAKNGLQPGMKLTVRNRHFMEKDYLDQLKDVLKDVLEKRHLGHLGKEKETVTKISKIGEWFGIALSLSNNLVSPWTAKIVEIGGPLYEKLSNKMKPLINKIGEKIKTLSAKISKKPLKQ